MMIWITLATLTYVIAGAWIWKTIVLRNVSTTDIAKCRTGEELNAICENQAMMQTGERDLTLAHLISKGVFILTWPLSMLAAFINARALQ
ncbi:MAG: hypothetical protein ACU0BN_12205 [Sulfitobacter sp.]